MGRTARTQAFHQNDFGDCWFHSLSAMDIVIDRPVLIDNPAFVPHNLRPMSSFPYIQILNNKYNWLSHSFHPFHSLRLLTYPQRGWPLFYLFWFWLGVHHWLCSASLLPQNNFQCTLSLESVLVWTAYYLVILLRDDRVATPWWCIPQVRCTLTCLGYCNGKVEPLLCSQVVYWYSEARLNIREQTEYNIWVEF